jgi:hypothetical protein
LVSKLPEKVHQRPVLDWGCARPVDDATREIPSLDVISVPYRACAKVKFAEMGLVAFINYRVVGPAADTDADAQVGISGFLKPYM